MNIDISYEHEEVWIAYYGENRDHFHNISVYEARQLHTDLGHILQDIDNG